MILYDIQTIYKYTSNPADIHSKIQKLTNRNRLLRKHNYEILFFYKYYSKSNTTRKMKSTYSLDFTRIFKYILYLITFLV